MLYNPQTIEKEILKFWETKKIFDKLRKKIKGNRPWSFMDGPITANNPMGVHHAWGRTYKDLFQRFKAMQRFDQRFQNGFDSQGLWVEVEVEKDIGFNSKRDIEKFGVDKFSKACRKRVEKYSAIQTNQSIKLGMWMDWKNSYYTMSDNNNLHIWHFLKKCHELGWLYRGTNVMPWCIRCGTSLSQHELFDSYKDLTHTAVFFKVPIKGRKNEFLLIWSTTPWTFPADVAAAVNPDLDYVLVGHKNEMYYLSEKTLHRAINGEYTILDHFKGKKLVGLEYEGPFDYLPALKGIKHKVVAWDLVGEEEGTGIVHIAPGCGAEDHVLGKKEKLAVLAPLDEDGNYIDGYDWLTGKNVKDVGNLIIKDMERRGFLYRTEQYKHRYPHCWRCGEELVFRLVNEWFIKTDPLRKKLIQLAKKIKWSPDYTMKRQIDWFVNMGDWCISRKRYWGLCIPFWDCSCGHLEVFGSKEELRKKAVNPKKVDKLPELHKPWVDEIEIKCPKCGKNVKRIKEIGDCWLDAGIVSFSTLNYLKDKKYWKKWFPPEFVTESGPGQYRCWFYSMFFMTAALAGTIPFKSILPYDLVKDEKGENMHKSAGNAIWFDDAVEKIGADVMRWMYTAQNPASPLLFGYKAAIVVKKKLDIFFNLANYIQTYLEDNKFKKSKTIKPTILNKWFLSRLEILKRDVTKHLDDLEPNKANLEIEEFFLNEFSRFYVHLIRDKIKRGYVGKDKEQVLQTLYIGMLEILKLMAPFVPFVTEKIYQNFFRKFEKKESIHLLEWPKVDKKTIDEKLESNMLIVKSIIETVNSLRQEQGIKSRWPLTDIVIKFKPDVKGEKLVKELGDVIKQLANVKFIKVVKKLGKGKTFQYGKIELGEVVKDEAFVRELTRMIQKLRKENKLKVSESIELYLNSDKKTEEILNKFEKEILTGVGGKKVEIGEIKFMKGGLNFEDKKVEIGFKRV